ncbi:MAG: hypothetical protein N3H31_05805 [Candidatus Nezhaarchaeota archaeon]|nr:hypothetical protein [Candidatus Nezhaarchaeota archaeon]
MEASRLCPRCGASMKPHGLSFCAGLLLTEGGRGAWLCSRCHHLEAD